jgi:hypothetical protein
MNERWKERFRRWGYTPPRCAVEECNATASWWSSFPLVTRPLHVWVGLCPKHGEMLFRRVSTSPGESK